LLAYIQVLLPSSTRVVFVGDSEFCGTAVKKLLDRRAFRRLEKHAFDIEQTRLHHFLRLTRLTLAAALLYVFLVAFGSYVVKCGWRKVVDRTDRRDLSIFRIGYDMFERCLSLGQPVSLRLIPYF
jgi:hypothetical protein